MKATSGHRMPTENKDPDVYYLLGRLMNDDSLRKQFMRDPSALIRKLNLSMGQEGIELIFDAFNKFDKADPEAKVRIADAARRGDHRII